MKETFAEYSARLLSLAPEANPLDVLEQTPARLGELLAGCPAALVHARPAPDRWSIAEIVSHLADAEIVFAYRVRMILAAPGRAIEAYDQDAWSRAQHAESSDVHASLSLFAAIRASQVALLRRLGDDELDRFGMHAERGRESVRHLARLHAGHDRNHLAQIARIASLPAGTAARSAP